MAHTQAHSNISAPLPLGVIVMTPGAIDALAAAGQEAASLIARHARGDWGSVSPEDAMENDRAVVTGHRVLSRYVLANQAPLWVITESDRSVTTILLPEEY